METVAHCARTAWESLCKRYENFREHKSKSCYHFTTFLRVLREVKSLFFRLFFSLLLLVRIFRRPLSKCDVLQQEVVFVVRVMCFGNWPILLYKTISVISSNNFFSALVILAKR